MAQRFRGYEIVSDYDMRFSDRCPTDSDPSEAPSEDSDNSSAAPPRRYRAAQKGHRSRNNKVRTLNRWTTEEHDKLAYLVDKWGSEKNWAKVAEEMPGRTGKQCRERWLNHMKPGIIKGNWSPEEEYLLAQCHALVGSHWSKMTKRLPGRTENSIKNFWNATLRSKAPNKKRGMLWTYMQLHDPKSDDNTLALTSAVSRLHETRELPQFLLAQLDEGLLDSRTWKAVHKAEKEFLENIAGELHYLSLPHPSQAGTLSAVTGLHGYCGGAAAAVTAAANTSPADSPMTSLSQIPDYTGAGYGHQYAASYMGQVQTGSYLHRSSTATEIKMADDTMAGLLTATMPGTVSSSGAMHSSTAATNAAAYPLPTNLLTAQDPLLSCAAHDNVDHSELLKMFETGSTAGQQGQQLGGCSTLTANNGSIFGDGCIDAEDPAATTTVAAATAGLSSAASMVPRPKELLPIATAIKVEEQQQSEAPGSSSSYHAHSHLSVQDASGPGSKASSLATDGQAVCAAAGEPSQAASNSQVQQHISPVPSCEPGTGTPLHGSPLLNAIGSAQQHTQAPGSATANIQAVVPGTAYCNAAYAAVGDFNRCQSGSPAVNDIRSDTNYVPPHSSRAAPSSRPAGGHGPHCSCGPCSNSRKLHGLHSPGARRQARSNATTTQAQRYRSMASLTSDTSMAACQQASKLQRQSYAVHPEHGAAAGYQMLDVQSYQMMQQQYYNGTGMGLQQQQHQQTAMPVGATNNMAQAGMFQQYASALSVSAQGPELHAPALRMQHLQQDQPRCESPFAAQPTGAGWGVAPAASTPAGMQPPALQLPSAPDTVTADVIGSMPWFRSSDAAPPQQGIEIKTQQEGDQQPGQHQEGEAKAEAEAARQMPAPAPQQQQAAVAASSRNLPPIKGLDLSNLPLPGLGPDSLAGFLLSPMGLGLLSPLGGLMLPPPSTRSVRLPSFGQITLQNLQRVSINGCDWDWDALLGADNAAVPPSTRPSENGDSLTTALAGSSGPASAPRSGVKRGRCSLTSLDDDGALLIDVQPAKVPRSSETSASGTVLGANWTQKDFQHFLNRFD